MTSTARQEAAAFIVAEAAALGIAIGTDGSELVAITPGNLPLAVRRSFQAAVGDYCEEIIAHLLATEVSHGDARANL
jgi:hypothetical protein